MTKAPDDLSARFKDPTMARRQFQNCLVLMLALFAIEICTCGFWLRSASTNAQSQLGFVGSSFATVVKQDDAEVLQFRSGHHADSNQKGFSTNFQESQKQLKWSSKQEEAQAKRQREQDAQKRKEEQAAREQKALTSNKAVQQEPVAKQQAQVRAPKRFYIHDPCSEILWVLDVLKLQTISESCKNRNRNIFKFYDIPFSSEH